MRVEPNVLPVAEGTTWRGRERPAGNRWTSFALRPGPGMSVGQRWAASVAHLPWNGPCFSSSPFSSCTLQPLLPVPISVICTPEEGEDTDTMSRQRGSGVKWPHTCCLPSFSKSHPSWVLRCLSLPDPFSQGTSQILWELQVQYPNCCPQWCPMSKHLAFVYEACIL